MRGSYARNIAPLPRTDSKIFENEVGEVVLPPTRSSVYGPKRLDLHPRMADMAAATGEQSEWKHGAIIRIRCFQFLTCESAALPQQNTKQIFNRC